MSNYSGFVVPAVHRWNYPYYYKNNVPYSSLNYFTGYYHYSPRNLNHDGKAFSKNYGYIRHFKILNFKESNFQLILRVFIYRDNHIFRLLLIDLTDFILRCNYNY